MALTPDDDTTHHPYGATDLFTGTDSVVRWRRYVALGDSFTEGLWDLPEADPGSDPLLNPGPCRGWADLLAGHLARRRRAGTSGHGSTGSMEYANLAVRGRLLRPILREQVPAALELRPDLVSLVGGGNDMLRPVADPDRMAVELERAVVRLREAGADVLLGTGVDSKDSPLVSRTRHRTALYNTHIWSIARRHGAHVVDLWGMRSLRDWRMWAGDRIHLTTEGHRRVAQGALVALGLTPDDERWDDPLSPLPPVPRAERVRENAQWVRQHVYPWATRRLRGRSSGDTRRPKRPEPVTVEVVGEGDPSAVRVGQQSRILPVPEDRAWRTTVPTVPPAGLPRADHGGQRGTPRGTGLSGAAARDARGDRPDRPVRPAVRGEEPDGHQQVPASRDARPEG